MTRGTCEQIQGFPECMGEAVAPNGCTCKPADLRRVERNHLVEIAKEQGVPIGLVIECALCQKVVSSPGALLFSPPDESGRCEKSHLCARCYGAVLRTVKKRREAD